MSICCPLRRSLVAVAFLVLAACGGDDEAPKPTPEGGGEADWSRPTEAAASGSPDGDGAHVRTPDELLEDLRTRVASGRGHSDPSYQRSVENVASVLFDTGADASEEDLLGARSHMQVAAIVGEVGGWLAASKEARAEREKSHPTDVAIHDRFLEVAVGGPDAYAVWCRTDAPELLKAHREATYARLMGDN